MPKLRKEDTASLDVDELEAAEYTEGNFTKYGGDIPPNDTILTAFVSKMWWTRTQGGDAMLKVLVEAAENEGDLEEYNGLPCWENMALTTGAKFKWAPFLEHFGLTIRDVKNKTVVAADDDNMGAPIEHISTFSPGGDESWCRIVIARERYDGAWQAHVAAWLPWDEDADEDAEEADDVEDEEAEDEEEEEEDEEAEEVEEEPEPTPPARGRRAPAKPAAAPARQAAKPAATARKAPAATPARTPARRAATPATPAARAKPAAAAATPARGRGRKPAGDEPPF